MRVYTVQPFVQPFREAIQRAQQLTSHPSLEVTKIDRLNTHQELIKKEALHLPPQPDTWPTKLIFQILA